MRFIILMVIITAAVAAGLGILWISGSHSTPAPVPVASVQPAPAQVATVDVLVARADIPVGTVLTPDMIDRQPWPKHLVLEGFITADSPDANIAGEVTRSDFRARQPILKTELANGQGAGFLASSLDKGMRAVTLGVDTVSGVAGYIFPGDHVDIILTHSLDRGGNGGSAPAPSLSGITGIAALAGLPAPAAGGGGGGEGATTSEVLLPNAKVLAVDVHKAPPPSADTASRLGMGMSQAVQQQSEGGDITLELSQEDAKKLRLAEKNGTLSLALRSVEDIKDNDVGEPVTLSDITRLNADVHVQAVAPSSDVIITRGPPQ